MEEKQGFFKRLVSGLTKTRDNIVSGMDSIFHGFSHIDEDFYEELEETLIMGDLGVHTTMEIIEDLREKVKAQHIKEPIECRQLLIDSIKEQMDVGETAYEFEEKQSVVFVIGVNGVGKTTTIGKLAGKFRAEHKKVDPCGGGYVPCGGGGTVERVGEPCTGGDDRRSGGFRPGGSRILTRWQQREQEERISCSAILQDVCTTKRI